MMRREEKWMCERTSLPSVTAALLLALPGCVATPLPTPPSANAEKMELVAPQAGQVTLRGSAGAIQPGGLRLRVSGPSASIDTTAAGDGSFTAALDGRRSDELALEALLEDGPELLLVITGGPGESVDVVLDPADGGGDANDPTGDDPNGAGDDVADDPCNGVDDDRDGVVDEGCDPANECRNDFDCVDGGTCTNGSCNA